MYVPLEITSFFGVGFPARAFCHDRMSFYQNSWYQTEFTLEYKRFLIGLSFVVRARQIVKQIGNAVPPLLAKAIGESIAKAEADSMGSHESSQTVQSLIRTV